MADNNMPASATTNSRTETPSSLPSPSTPLHISGFLSGDTIQLKGDTDNLQFSVQFSIHHKHYYPENQSPANHYPFLDTMDREYQTFPSSSSSFYRTPPPPPMIPSHEEQLQNENEIVLAPTTDQINDEVRRKSTSIVTRLRSGVLTPVKYYPHHHSLRSWRGGGSRKRGDVLERVLRRHSFPIRPCSSYSFFVMSNWDAINSNTFGEKSKMLGEMWCKLPQHQKQIFEEMALTDSARYKKQCMLLAEEEV